MSVFGAIRRIFLIRANDIELVHSQTKAFARQIPIMYAMLITNTVVLAYTHFHVAPRLLTLYIPGALVLFSSLRVVYWWTKQKQHIADAQARRLLTSSVAVAGLLGISYSIWALTLLPYGDGFLQSQIPFFIGITALGTVFCLMHLGAAAVAVGISLILPSGIIFVLSGNFVLIAETVDLVLVLLGISLILMRNFSDFEELVTSRRDMRLSHRDMQKLSDENYRLAYRDPLTDLPNRREFFRQLESMLEQAHQAGAEIAVACIDIDGFKAVNDIFGHLTGDHVLADVGARLVALHGPATFVARLGGDDFALILVGPVSESRLAACGGVICDTLRQPYFYSSAKVRVTSSVGFAASMPGDTAETIYDRADYAAFVAKQEKRGGVEVFSQRHANDISKVRALEHALLTCDMDEEIYIVFQPLFDVGPGRTVGYEVLARWRNPVLGEISPGEFIPLAERIGVISKITQTVLRKAIAVAKVLPKPLRLSVNLSANDLCSQTAVEAIAAIMQQADNGPCRVDFEITETAVMRDIEQANLALLTLLSLGSRISLDDFGTGHSSMTYVQKLPLDRIKVDRSFVTDVASDPASRAIVKTTIDLCHNLGISCIFEGIETDEQLDALLALGGTLMQGYYFGKPMSEELVLEHSARESAASVLVKAPRRASARLRG